jgi:GrpB-like predicted nucleotidyltransferase (UPF0157 family)
MVTLAILSKGCGMELDVLAVLAGNTLVTVAVTDTFETVRHRVARLFGRGNPDKGTERRLEATRQELTAAHPREAEAVRARLAGQWRTRFADLLADHPDAATELDALIADLRAHATDADRTVTNTITGAVVHGPVLMGRDFGDITIESAGTTPGQP